MRSDTPGGAAGPVGGGGRRGPAGAELTWRGSAAGPSRGGSYLRERKAINRFGEIGSESRAAGGHASRWYTSWPRPGRRGPLFASLPPRPRRARPDHIALGSTRTSQVAESDKNNECAGRGGTAAAAATRTPSACPSQRVRPQRPALRASHPRPHPLLDPISRKIVKGHCFGIRPGPVGAGRRAPGADTLAEVRGQRRPRLAALPMFAVRHRNARQPSGACRQTFGSPRGGGGCTGTVLLAFIFIKNKNFLSSVV